MKKLCNLQCHTNCFVLKKLLKMQSLILNAIIVLELYSAASIVAVYMYIQPMCEYDAVLAWFVGRTCYRPECKMRASVCLRDQ